MESYSNDMGSFKRFLDNFCRQLKTREIDYDRHPLKLVYFCLLQSEFEAECLDWTLQYLTARNCPYSLAACIARCTYEEFPRKDVRQLYDIHQDGVQLPEIDARRLLKEVILKVNEVCQHLQSSLPMLKIPDRIYEVSSHAIKNTRRKMEDRHIVLPDLNNLFALDDYPTQSYFAVFDGHAGVEAAVYAATHLHCNIIKSSFFANDVSTALKCAYKETDEMFMKKSEMENLHSGTTGVSALIRGSTMYLGWLGDSQALLVRNGQALTIMTPHKPERDDEKQRIEELGGIVLVVEGIWRVNGNISVSRAIGDARHKPYICSDADVVSVDLDGSEDYLVLACDGVWDYVSKEILPSIIYDSVQKNSGKYSAVAENLVHFAQRNGSTDNISVVIVFFKDHLPDPRLVSGEMVKENGEKNCNTGIDKNNKSSGNSASSSSYPREKPFSSSSEHKSKSANGNQTTPEQNFVVASQNLKVFSCGGRMQQDVEAFQSFMSNKYPASQPCALVNRTISNVYEKTALLTPQPACFFCKQNQQMQKNTDYLPCSTSISHGVSGKNLHSNKTAVFSTQSVATTLSHQCCIFSVPRSLLALTAKS